MTFVDGNLLLAEHINLGQDRLTSTESEIPGHITAAQEEPSLPPQPAEIQIPETPPSIRTPKANKKMPTTHAQEVPSVIPANLNTRQQKAWPAIVAANGTNRALYQSAIGEEISVRTAQYDLQDMVNKGLLSKSGKGPSSRYLIVNRITQPMTTGKYHGTP